MNYYVTLTLTSEELESIVDGDPSYSLRAKAASLLEVAEEHKEAIERNAAVNERWAWNREMGEMFKGIDEIIDPADPR